MIRLRSLASDTLIYGFTSAARSLVGLLLVPIYTRVFQLGDYGRIDTLTTMVAALTLVLALGMDTAAALYYYDNTGTRDRATMLTTTVVSRVTLSGLAALLINLLAPYLSQQLFETTDHASAVRMAVWTAPVGALVGFFIEMLRLARRPWLYSGLAVTNLLTGVTASILFVVVLHWGVPGAFAGPLVGNAVVLPFALWLVRKELAPHFSLHWLKRLLHVGLPLVPSGFGGWIIAYANRYVLLYLGSAAAVGLLAVGNKVSAPLVLFTAAFRIAWGPFAFSIQKQETARDAYAKTLTYFCLISGTMAIATSLFAREVLLVFTTHQYVAGYIVTGPMTLQLIADSCYYIVSIGLLITKRTHWLAYVMPVVAISSLAFNFLLVPLLGYFGAALANALVYCLYTSIIFILSQRAFPVPYETGKLLRLFLLWLAAWGLGMLASQGRVWLGVGLKSLILAGFIGGLFLLRIVEGREVSLLTSFVGRQWQAFRQARLRAAS